MNDEVVMEQGIPELAGWEAEPGKEFYLYENEVVKARYDRLGMQETNLQIFYIEMAHYKSRMPDIVRHINYFLTYFDTERESFLSILSVKYMVDTHKDMPEKDFIRFMLDRVITPSFIAKCKAMAHYLYHVNVNTDPDGKYKNSPKITNEQAKQIVALSFCFRFILPICIHYHNVGDAFVVKDVSTGKEKRVSYLDCFDRLFGRIVKMFEYNDIKIYTTLCKFIVHRAEKAAQNNKTIFAQKEMIRGDSLELYVEQLIHEVIIVKSLYKLDYTKSCVSFFDGIVGSFGMNYNKENYASKPAEIDSPDTTKDSDDHPSHAEAIEMSVYKIDESNPIINDVNRFMVLREMRPHFKTLGVSKDSAEYNFYLENMRFSEVSDALFHAFYSKKFKDPFAVYGLNREDRVELQLYMKKYLEVRCMPLLAQMCTAIVRGKYKENVVKSARFAESMVNHPVYDQILSTKFVYLKELDQKVDPILRKFSGFINCSFEFIDFDPEINGYILDDIDIEQIRNEFLIFLTIV